MQTTAIDKPVRRISRHEWDIGWLVSDSGAEIVFFHGTLEYYIRRDLRSPGQLFEVRVKDSVSGAMRSSPALFETRELAMGYLWPADFDQPRRLKDVRFSVIA